MAAVQSEAGAQPPLPDYMLDPNAVLGDVGAEWRNTRPPDYSKTRSFYSETKRCKHEAGSLPELVENLVKNWEIEASFKTRLSDWRTIDDKAFTFSVNDLKPCSAEHMLRVGTYNAVISPCEYYDPGRSDFAASHKTFKRMMPTFAWEVLEVHSGPPVVSFKWRHWGEMKNDYVGQNRDGEKVTVKANGQLIDIEGVTVAHLNSKFQVTELKTWFDSNEMFKQMDPDGVAINKSSE
ncbi:uncharacterized protein F4807DRAFT_443821 [Annulohypoxylon truncatum]|uniref:uncharacterized protein n=1 Tax=Annulohypoxylon truncatum TaxID=327061 RepID=UPI002007F06A|nr:uncharacterized protein F4807DRAFT_443821 [Annulohypoxylon truncatum]KAI1205192.1 hypothetical protein F4807DRAFT_443821 [Annulohypoxylon truncatum]